MLNKYFTYLKRGFWWAFPTFVALAFILPYINNESITLKSVVSSFIGFVLVAGPLFGLVDSWRPFEIDSKE